MAFVPADSSLLPCHRKCFNVGGKQGDTLKPLVYDMTKSLKFFLTSALLLVIVVCFLFFSFTQKSRDWDFIQKVGGIKTENPLATEDGLYLPVMCNVSGTDSITNKPTLLNSALICKKIRVDHQGNKIYLTVITGLPVLGKATCNCKAVDIGNLDNGSYDVYYKDKSSSEHLIGHFSLTNK